MVNNNYHAVLRAIMLSYFYLLSENFFYGSKNPAIT
jgi:hypothetical protein